MLFRSHPDAGLILLWPEANTRNIGYADNINVLREMILASGRECLIGSPELSDFEELQSSGEPIELSPVSQTADGVLVAGRRPDLIICNNDQTHEPILTGGIPITPPSHLGWYRRRKSDHFRILNPLIEEVAEIIGIDPWLLRTRWIVSENKCLEEESCLLALAAEINEFLDELRQRYSALGIDLEPRLFVKNDSGTYGLGIIEIDSGDEILTLSNRRMKRLNYGKGGASVDNYLIQEGVPTALKWGESVVEPCGYSIAMDSPRWFFRVNAKRGILANLNTPSTEFLLPAEIASEGSDSNVRANSQWHELLARISMLPLAVE